MVTGMERRQGGAARAGGALKAGSADKKNMCLAVATEQLGRNSNLALPCHAGRWLACLWRPQALLQPYSTQQRRLAHLVGRLRQPPANLPCPSTHNQRSTHQLQPAPPPSQPSATAAPPPSINTHSHPTQPNPTHQRRLAHLVGSAGICPRR